jgi:putative spermidine/putrescine transport system ATP-binding protein/spermidine/putrescine transport system ATP-binding protein
VLRGRLERIEGGRAIVALGVGRVAVPTRTLEGCAVDSSVDLFVRPEDLRVAESEAVAAVYGTVAAQIYQGGHIDLYVDVPEASSERVLLRVLSHEAASSRPPGTRIGIALAADVAIAFPSA